MYSDLSDNKKFKKTYFHGNVDAINNRREEVKKIMSELKEQGLPVNRYSVHERLDKTKFDVSLATVYNDIVSLSRENTWVRDLTESTYSAHQEEINDTLDWIQKEARRLYDVNWVRSKKVTKKVPAKNGKNKVIVEMVKIKEEYKPKASILKIIRDVQDLKMKLTNGQNINISAALLGKKFEKAKAQLRDKEEILAQMTAATFMDLQQKQNALRN